MFETNADFDFDDNLELNHSGAKRPSPPSPVEVNKRPKTEIPPKLPKNVVKRKFPGPAGILPERKDFNFSVLDARNKNPSDEVPCSQMSLSVFQNSPWLEMLRDYETLVDSYNIKWIKIRAGFNKLPNRKAPFLAAIIQSIECFDENNPTVNVVLKDTTGEIQGTVIHTLYEEYSSCLIVGAVIVLKQFGVLTTGSNNNHHLTITQNNLATVYVKKNGGEVTVIKVQEVNCQDLTKNSAPVKVNKSDKVLVPENSNIFEDDFQIPDNFEESLTEEVRKEEKKKFHFKKPISQISVNTNDENTEIWQKALEGVDADSFFSDF